MQCRRASSVYLDYMGSVDVEGRAGCRTAGAFEWMMQSRMDWGRCAYIHVPVSRRLASQTKQGCGRR